MSIGSVGLMGGGRRGGVHWFSRFDGRGQERGCPLVQ